MSTEVKKPEATVLPTRQAPPSTPILALEKHLKDRADRIEAQIPAVMKRVLTPERMIALAMSAMKGNEKLQRCSPDSIFGSILALTQVGLEPNTPLQQAWLVPYKGECKPILGYRGKLTIAHDCGAITMGYAATVLQREVDEGHFRMQRGTSPLIHHEPLLDPNEKDTIAGFYAVVKTGGGEIDFEYMSKFEVDLIRARSKSPDEGPWATDYAEQGKKTVIHRLLKRQALNPTSPHARRYEKAAEIEEEEYIDTKATVRDMPDDEPAPKGMAGLVAATKPKDVPKLDPEARKRVRARMDVDLDFSQVVGELLVESEVTKMEDLSDSQIASLLAEPEKK